MTPVNQFDPFERRITDAIDEIASAQRPAYLDDVLRLTARTSQRSRRAFWRHTSMNRLAYAAAAVAVVAVLAGGALLFKPPANNGGPPSPAPTQSASPTSTPVLAPESLRSTWLASTGSAASAGAAGSFVRLVISAKGDRMSVFDGGTETLVSSPIAGPTTEFDIASTDSAGGCQVGDIGSYSFAFGTDGSVPNSDRTLLTLNVISDTCSARSALLNRSWTHAIDAGSNGGRGVSTAFSPMFLITMPAAGYTADPGTDSLTLTSSTPDRTLIAVKNPVGWTDPCSSKGGSKLPVAPTIKAFTAYMQTLPGFTVQSSALQIDGHPASHLIIPTTQTADCGGNRVQEWSAGADTGSGGWLLRQGDTDVLYLVEVDGDLILLQWLGQDVTSAEEQALFATVHFTDALPQ